MTARDFAPVYVLACVLCLLVGLIVNWDIALGAGLGWMLCLIVLTVRA